MGYIPSRPGHIWKDHDSLLCKKEGLPSLKSLKLWSLTSWKAQKTSSRDLKFHQNVEPGPPKENTSLVSFKWDLPVDQQVQTPIWLTQVYTQSQLRKKRQNLAKLGEKKVILQVVFQPKMEARTASSLGAIIVIMSWNGFGLVVWSLLGMPWRCIPFDKWRFSSGFPNPPENKNIKKLW